MASNAGSFSYIASTTQESVRARGPTSAVWEHSRIALPGEDPAYRYCIRCIEENIVLIFKVKGVPTNLRRYLQAIYSITIDATIGPI